MVPTGLGKCPNKFTSPLNNYWGYHLQQIFENDVKQIPKIGHSPSPGTVNFTFSPHYFTGLPSDIVVFPVASQLTES